MYTFHEQVRKKKINQLTDKTRTSIKYHHTLFLVQHFHLKDEQMHKKEIKKKIMTSTKIMKTEKERKETNHTKERKPEKSSISTLMRKEHLAAPPSWPKYMSRQS